MKNPQITAKLNAMMLQQIAIENQDRNQMIATILDYERENQLIKDEESEFNRACDLIILSIGDLCAIIGDISSDLWSEIFYKFGCKPDEF